MRNRIWLAAIAGVAAVAVAVQFQSANSQEAKTRAAKGAAKAEHSHDHDRADHGSSKVTYAVAVVHALGDHKVSGKVTFTQKDDGVEIVGEFTGLQPGEHGFHIHEFGDCSMADGKCAGGHFNPSGMPHAGQDDAKRHAGDCAQRRFAAARQTIGDDHHDDRPGDEHDDEDRDCIGEEVIEAHDLAPSP